MAASVRLKLPHLALVIASLNLFAAEKQIARADLPAPVQRTADEQARGATVRGYSKDVENGRVEYEVQLADRGHNRDITIASDGTLIEIEEQVSIAFSQSSLRFDRQSGGRKNPEGRVSHKAWKDCRVRGSGTEGWPEI